MQAQLPQPGLLQMRLELFGDSGALKRGASFRVEHKLTGSPARVTYRPSFFVLQPPTLEHQRQPHLADVPVIVLSVRTNVECAPAN